MRYIPVVLTGVGMLVMSVVMHAHDIDHWSIPIYGAACALWGMAIADLRTP